jgi:hypothetical protein
MTDFHSIQSMDLPGSDLDVTKMSGHWLAECAQAPPARISAAGL